MGLNILLIKSFRQSGHQLVLGWHQCNTTITSFNAVKYILGFVYSPVLVDDMAKRPDHRNWIITLPYIPSKVYSDGAVVHSIFDEVHNLSLGVSLRSSSHNDRYWAAVNTRIDLLTPLGLYHFGT